MKAYYLESYGGPESMTYGDLSDPLAGNGQVLVEVRASPVHPLDWKLRSGMLKLLPIGGLPRPLGSDLAGVVTGFGPDVSGFAVGDRVYGAVPIFLGQRGAHAEFCVTKAKNLRRMPEGWTFEQAAALPVAALTALNGLRQCGDLAGKTVLVNGATGGVGHFALQIAKARGAKVVAVCSAKNAELARTLGADEVIDYHEEDVTAPGHTWDVFFDAFGQVGFARAEPVLREDGAYATTLPRPDVMIRSVLSRILGGKQAVAANMRSKPEDYAELERLIQGGVKPVIEQVFPLERAADAFAVCEAGKVRGKVVITVERDGV
ncbi:MAG TPA: NAD(P)-dependent alcohol dehydrogenase [Candidatus Nanopelagicales bacterium]|nr:NAD(P)-dependent alcohol dehydrogenase [Candidatus Nanopelagicales bacterium]